jgi:hypothetical protein
MPSSTAVLKPHEKTTGPVGGPAAGDGASSVSPGALLPVSPLDAIAQHIDGAFVIVVRTSGGRYRRRCFLSAASAERAARNALEAGHDATVFLAELKPLWKLNTVTPDLFSDFDLGGSWS